MKKNKLNKKISVIILSSLTLIIAVKAVAGCRDVVDSCLVDPRNLDKQIKDANDNNAPPDFIKDLKIKQADQNLRCIGAILDCAKP